VHSIISCQKLRPQQVIATIYPILLAILLIITSLFLVTFTTIVSTKTLNQDSITPTAFTIASGKTYEFNVTLTSYTGPIQVGREIFSRGLYLGNGPTAWFFEVPPINNTLNLNNNGSVWLDVRLNRTGTLNASGTVLFGYPNNLSIDVYMPDGIVLAGNLTWTYGRPNHFISPITKVTTLGTYQFIITNNDSSNWSGTLAPNVQVQQIEKPHFYYGLTCLGIAVSYIGLLLYNVLKQLKAKTFI
jgi:hypothetical protein